VQLEKTAGHPTKQPMPTRQLILDMPVRWSSTYAMLHCADELKEVSNVILITDLIAFD